MAGRTPHEARNNFLAPLQRALSCVTNAQVVFRPNAPGDIEALMLSEQRVRIPRIDGGAPWWLTVEQRYALIETDDPDRGLWKVSTRAYRYRLDDNEGEVASWHWHPGGRSKATAPHMHLAHGPLSHAHLPTGRVGIESIIRLLLTDLGSRSNRHDWPRVLDAAKQRFQQWQTWS